MTRPIRSLLANRSGATALEFALVAPIFLGLVFGTFEAGWMMTKATLLDRALDLTVRQVRIGAAGAPKTQAAIRQAVCDQTLVIRDCMNAMTIEMIAVQSASDFPTSEATCVDRGASVKPTTSFRAADRSTIMFIRACVVSDPLTPLIGLALHMTKDSLGGYRIVSTSAFMNEPEA